MVERERKSSSVTNKRWRGRQPRGRSDLEDVNDHVPVWNSGCWKKASRRRMPTPPLPRPVCTKPVNPSHVRPAAWRSPAACPRPTSTYARHRPRAQIASWQHLFFSMSALDSSLFQIHKKSNRSPLDAAATMTAAARPILHNCYDRGSAVRGNGWSTARARSARRRAGAHLQAGLRPRPSPDPPLSSCPPASAPRRRPRPHRRTQTSPGGARGRARPTRAEGVVLGRVLDSSALHPSLGLRLPVLHMR